MKPDVVAEIKVLPLGSGSGVSQLVADCVKVIDGYPDITYRLGPMATTVEGPFDRILELVREMHEVPFTRGAVRVVTALTIDDRRDKPVTMNGKVKAVEEKLGDRPDSTLPA